MQKWRKGGMRVREASPSTKQREGQNKDTLIGQTDTGGDMRYSLFSFLSFFSFPLALSLACEMYLAFPFLLVLPPFFFSFFLLSLPERGEIRPGSKKSRPWPRFRMAASCSKLLMSIPVPPSLMGKSSPRSCASSSASQCSRSFARRAPWPVASASSRATDKRCSIAVEVAVRRISYREGQIQ